jgi:hypothetical protein
MIFPQAQMSCGYQERVNFCPASFSDDGWAEIRSTIVPFQVEGNGVFKLVEDTTPNDGHGVQFTYSDADGLLGDTWYRFTAEAKAAERTACRVDIGSYDNQVENGRVNINLSAGVVITATDATRVLIASAGSGWWRIATWVKTIAAPAMIAPVIYPTDATGEEDYDGDGVSGIYIRKPRFEIITPAEAVASS